MKMRDFIYCRVSTTEQTTENQLLELSRQGITAEPHRVFEEVVSGSVPMANRREFARMLDRLEKGDRLTVLKLDRLGRDALDVLSTVKDLQVRGISARSMDLVGADLTSAAGEMQLGMLAVSPTFSVPGRDPSTLVGLVSNSRGEFRTRVSFCQPDTPYSTPLRANFMIKKISAWARRQAVIWRG
ncbi:recombinase family protein [Citrobacter telavivensis]